MITYYIVLRYNRMNSFVIIVLMHANRINFRIAVKIILQLHVNVRMIYFIEQKIENRYIIFNFYNFKELIEMNKLL